MNEALYNAIEELQAQMRPLEDQIRPILDQINAKKELVNQLCVHAGAQRIYLDLDEGKAITASLGPILPDQYFGKATATVVRDILERRKKANLGAIPLQDLYEAMKAGGFEFDSRDPETARRSIAITLGKNTQTFIKVPSTGSWGLTEWYPNAKRNKQAASVTTTPPLTSSFDAVGDSSESEQQQATPGPR